MHFLKWIFGGLLATGLLYALLHDLAKATGAYLKNVITGYFYVPRIDVFPELDHEPFFSNRTDIKRIAFTLSNASTRPAKILDGCVRLSVPDKPAYGEEKYISGCQILHGEHKQFFVIFKPTLEGLVTSGEAILKAECYLKLERSHGKPHEQHNQYTYDRHKRRFQAIDHK